MPGNKAAGYSLQFDLKENEIEIQPGFDQTSMLTIDLMLFPTEPLYS